MGCFTIWTIKFHSIIHFVVWLKFNDTVNFALCLLSISRVGYESIKIMPMRHKMKSIKSTKHYAYMLRCADDKIYSGYTTVQCRAQPNITVDEAQSSLVPACQLSRPNNSTAIISFALCLNTLIALYIGSAVCS